MDEDGEIVESVKEYDEVKYGRIPRSTRIELAYSITGNAMGLLGEGNALIAKALNGEEVSAYKLQDYLDGVTRLASVIGSIVSSEAFSRTEVPF